MAVSHQTHKPALSRNMGLFSLIVYGVGDMVGAGIYGTVGKAAGLLGNAVWMAFVVSMVAAMLTGLSYASLASRYPRAAGAAYVTHRAFGMPFLSYLVGLVVTASGLTSMATSSNVFAETLHGLVGGVPVWGWIVVFLAFITFLNFWGIRESMWGNLLCTAVEVGGLVLIIALGMPYWGSVDYLQGPRDWTDAAGQMRSSLSLSLVLSGGVLTFFSFVGFEDMLNVAEEVKNPVRTMPWGIVIALLLTTALYMAVAITAVSVVPHTELAKAAAPLEVITRRAAPWLPPHIFTLITLFAVANTALINYIMGSRLIYGMARQGLVPRPLSRVHPWRRTPHVAILALMVIAIALALAGRVRMPQWDFSPVKQLADATALLLLGCFMVVNAALAVLKFRPSEPRGAFEIPAIIPALGVLACGGLMLARLTTPNAQGHLEWRAPAIALAVGLAVSALYLFVRPKDISEDVLFHAEHDHE